MSFFPGSLLARTALIILLALAATQAASFYVFNRFYSQPRQEIALAGFGSHLKSISAALETLPPDLHAEFISRLQEREGIRLRRILPEDAERDKEIVRVADFPGLRVARAQLHREFGDAADIFHRPRSPNIFLVRLPVGERQYWVVYPRNRIERDTGMAWIGWAVFGTVIALAGAFLLVRKVNQPLRQLARAARLVGKGDMAPPVGLEGPSEVQAVARAFNQMQDDLQRQARERATFLAGVSHDLRTPLSRMRLQIEMLGSQVDDATRTDMAADIEDMDVIIGQFLDFAREESAESPARLSLTTLIEEALARRSPAPQRVLEKVPDLMLRPLALRRLIGNLVDNAYKYGGEDVVVKTSLSDGRVRLSVLDRGPGIPAEEAERLKQPFTRLEEARTGAGGAGLGLAIVERIARLHGGQLDLLPREGGGLEARVTLPVT